MDATKRSFRNLTLSFRGSERQPRNSLQLALRFSKIMELREQQGLVLPGATVEDRLAEVVRDFHQSPGLLAKHRLDEDKMKAVQNLISGTTQEGYL